MESTVQNQNNQDPRNYFYPYESTTGNSEYKEKVSLYGNKFRYYAVQVWPYVTKTIDFFFFWTKKTIGGIISIGKDQIKGS